jgi:TRAP-type C4-dicarboxylate transport system substrate-binding protein
MMLRRDVLKVTGALTVAGILGFPRRARAAGETIKVGTLFPKSSPWGKVCETWIKAVNEKSGGKLELQFFYNGQQGDEAAMVGKIKSGQLDGAALTGAGLGKVYLPILALQMPLFKSWARLDKARAAMASDLEKGAAAAGFFLAGTWGSADRSRRASR